MDEIALRNQFISTILPEDQIRQLYERLKKVKDKHTPSSQIKMKGGFPFAEYSYMLDEFEKTHPMYRIEIDPSGTFFNEKYIIYHCAVKITDIATGECRPGVAAHPAIAFDSKERGGAEKSISEIRELMGNAYKASLTEAIRNGLSNWGISADLYGVKTIEPRTPKQIEEFNEYDRMMEEMKIESYTGWWTEIKAKWLEQTKESADAYLLQIKPVVEPLYNKFKEKING